MLNGIPTRAFAVPVAFFAMALQASSLSDVIESFRQNRNSLRNGAGSYQGADPADRIVIQGYYAELEAAALLEPMTKALETTAANSGAMIAAIKQAVARTEPVSKKIESCLGSRELSVEQNVLEQGAKSSRAQLERTYAGRGYSSPVELDLDGTVRAYNVISGRNWHQDFVTCCKEAASEKLNLTDRSNKRDTVGEALQNVNQTDSTKLAGLINDSGCEKNAERIAIEQTKFVTQDYHAPSRVIDPLEGLKMSAVEVAIALRSSGVRGGLRRIRQEAHSPTAAMFEELSYFEEIDTSCKKAKDEQYAKQHSMFNTVAKIGLNAAICHVLPLVATENWTTGKANITYAVADATAALPWKDLQCDPNETQAYRAQRPTDPNEVAKKWNIPQIQNPEFLNRLRGMVPLTAAPIVRSPDGSIIMPGGVLGGATPSRAQIEEQYLAQQNNSNSNISLNSSANLAAPRQVSVNQNYAAASRLAFLSGGSTSGSSTRYVRSANNRALSGRSIAGAVNGVRSLASNIETGSSRAPQSATALRQSASQGRSLASSMVSEHKGRGLAAMSSMRSASAGVTRGLVNRSVASKSSRMSAEWVAKILRDRRTPANPSGNDVVLGNGGKTKDPTAEEKQDRIIDELVKANQRRRDALIAQADSMVNSIQRAVTRSQEIVNSIQSKITSRDVLFNKTVEDMLKKPPKSQYSMVKNLITQDGARLQEIGVLKAEYDALAASIPMLTNSLNRLGGLAPQIQTQVGSALGTSQFATLPTAGNDGRFGTGNAGTSVFAPASSVPAPTVNATNGQVTKVVSPLESFALKLLVPEAWATSLVPGTLAYERKWSQAYDSFASDWDGYVLKLREVEQSDRRALLSRFRELTKAPDKLALREPDAATFSLMWDTMEVISEESKNLLQNRRADGPGNLARSKSYQDVEVAQVEADKTIDLLAEWAQMYTKSAPKSYYDDPQVWEAILPDAILY